MLCILQTRVELYVAKLGTELAALLADRVDLSAIPHLCTPVAGPTHVDVVDLRVHALCRLSVFITVLI